MSSSSLVRQRIAQDVKDVLDGTYPPAGPNWLSSTFSQAQKEADRSNFDQLQRVYQACERNEPATSLRDLKAVMETIADLYPAQKDVRRRRRGAADNAADKAAAMGRTLAFFTKAGLPSLVQLVVSDPRIAQRDKPLYDDDNRLRNFLEVSPGNDVEDVNATGSWFLFAPTQAYSDLGAELLSAVHPGNLGRDAAQALMKRIVELEFALERISNDAKAGLPERVNWSDLDKYAPHFNLSHVVRSMGYEPDRVLFNVPNYFANSSRELLANNTDATIQGFFMWKAIKKLAPYVGAELTNKFALREGAGGLAGRTAVYSRSTENCVAMLDKGAWWTTDLFVTDVSTTAWALGRFFVERVYPPETRNASAVMTGHIQSQLAERVLAADWLTAKDRTTFSNSIRNVKLILGYNDSLADPLFSKERMAGLGPTLSGSNVRNALALARADTARIWAGLTKDPEVVLRVLWTPLTIDAQYNPSQNEINFPAGQSQAIVSGVIPAYATYSWAGAVLGHELGHIVDGRTSAIWRLEPESTKAMQERVRCIEYQYGNMTFIGNKGTPVNIRGLRKTAECIADQHGLQSSYAAWKALQKTPETRDQGLPGLEGFTTDQLFFITCK